jgi:hypothetical protein
MAPPFIIQYLNPLSDSSTSAWIDFCFVDQLEIVARICRCVGSVDTSDRQVHFSAIGSTCQFYIQVVGEKIDMFILRPENGKSRDGVRMVGVNGFFGKQLFADNVICP